MPSKRHALFLLILFKKVLYLKILSILDVLNMLYSTTIGLYLGTNAFMMHQPMR